MTPADVRQRLVEALEADLVGPFIAEGHPGGGQEVLPLPPSRWYLTGFLAPHYDRAPDGDDTDAVGELGAGSESQAEDAGNDEPDAKRKNRFPASMGLSVFLPPPAAGAPDHIEVVVAFAEYIKEEVAEDNEKKAKVGWRRVPHGPYTVQVPLDPRVLASRDGVRWPEATGLRLRGELRTTEIDGLPPGARVLSIFLVNERPPLDRDRDLNFIFQVRLTLRYPRGFLARPNRRGEEAADDDQRVLALMFRGRYEWAVGHNTSVDLPRPDPDGAVRELRTTQLPRYEVLGVEHVRDPAKIGIEVLGMRELASLDGPGLTRALTPLIDAYGAWIERQRYADLDARLDPTRRSLMDRASDTKDRMAEGIALLAADAEIREAFKIANLAMHAQALQADKLREDKRYKEGKLPLWRPFQLAFILQNLASLADPNHRDRAVADLIYFPTGGGKTEAYLGLIAFTLILRRLRGKSRPDEGRGVSVILRYTLRLLTLDQLDRAATLICALEELRRRDPKRLGNTRFAVGLWVGQSTTVNRLRDLHAALSDYTSGQSDTLFPLSTCPWCGERIKIENIKLEDDEGKPSKTRYTRAVVYCDGGECLYTESKRLGQGLPVLFVDEQIYQELPDFLVATVDKFAMMPWRGEAGMLFGRASHVDDLRAYGVMHAPPKGARPLPAGLLPPELIVQDELHLISGPLGTMVGLYEAAIEELSTRPGPDGEPVRPKILASTATVRRASKQIQALFGRRHTNLFPPPGVDAFESWFATVDPKGSGRRYVGVAAPGRAMKAILLRTYVALLGAAAHAYDPKGAPGQPADAYMTLAGYFNSLRELGGMRRLVEDDVRTRCAAAEARRPRDHQGAHPWVKSRDLREPVELTSRVATAGIAAAKRRLEEPHAGKEHVDVLLASNMISVGVDIDRLGLMVVAGQPKTTSEYIQASSRVGRQVHWPGLVVTCFNVHKPRDRSHYERFVAYHESFYRYVEAQSLTPFSTPALDRGLAGVLAALVRLGEPAMTPPEAVMDIARPRAFAESMAAVLAARAGAQPGLVFDPDAEAQRLQDLAQSLLDAWTQVVTSASQEGAGQRCYSPYDRPRPRGKPLLHTATDGPQEDTAMTPDEARFSAPTSMRDVEGSVHLWVERFQLGGRR
ncbi:MAG TPA: DISARM system helicase DrmA [Nannocystaceae bacterium]|nr:DISARM system helicase DrmA [Nannocystaceae bacterium]